MVPVKTSKGDIVFKKLDDIKETDLENLITKKPEQLKPAPATVPQMKKTQSDISPQPHEASPLNLSVEYP